eukprot:5220167-Pyramimonas_sp.AAC.1
MILGLPHVLKRKRRGMAQPTLQQTIPAESPADAATSSGAAALGQRTQQCSRPASRPRYQCGRQSYRAAPASAGPAASGTSDGWIVHDRIQSWAGESWTDEPIPE